VLHGIAPCPAGGRIEIRGAPRDGRIALSIRNDGCRDGATRRGTGMALDNLRARLALAFADAAELRADAQDAGFQVQLDFPYIRNTDAHSDRR
jgi:two-component system sensor histidine kinase AlgZ